MPSMLLNPVATPHGPMTLERSMPSARHVDHQLPIGDRIIG